MARHYAPFRYHYNFVLVYTKSLMLLWWSVSDVAMYYKRSDTCKPMCHHPVQITYNNYGQFMYYPISKFLYPNPPCYRQPHIWSPFIADLCFPSSFPLTACSVDPHFPSCVQPIIIGCFIIFIIGLVIRFHQCACSYGRQSCDTKPTKVPPFLPKTLWLRAVSVVHQAPNG